MNTSNSNAKILLKRVLSLTEFSPLILCTDSIAQTASHLIHEILHNAGSNGELSVVYVSFETMNCPAYATHYIDAESVGLEKLAQTISSYLPSSPVASGRKCLVVVDSINYIPKTQIAQFMASIGSRHASMLGVYHGDMLDVGDNTSDHYPSALSLLYFMATTVLDVSPIFGKDADEAELKEQLAKALIPRGLNNAKFHLTLTNRRKSGRSLVHRFYIDSRTHSYEVAAEIDSQVGESEDPEALQDLTTFNLSTSAKQKMAKDQVNLPFLDAQSFNAGGAIVYQFEKDDDYDEEDPYEDPF